MAQEMVKMVIYDRHNPDRVMHLEAPTPGHFTYVEPAFLKKWPDTTGVVVQEVSSFPNKGEIAKHPLSEASIRFVG